MIEWYRVLHAIPGRLRFRAALQRDDLPLLGRYLQQQTGIEDIRVNCDCGSVVVRYDHARFTQLAIVDVLKRFSLEEQRRLDHEPATTIPASESLWPLGMSTAAVLLGWVESSFAPWLLAGAAWPIFLGPTTPS